MAAAAARLIPPSLRVEALLVGDDGLTIRVAAEAAEARCPLCGEPSERVHSRSERVWADLPWAGIAVRLRVRVRKFFCEHPACPLRIFAERLDGLAAVSARRTERQQAALLRIAIANGGEAGARLATDWGIGSVPTPCCGSSGRRPSPPRPRPRCSASTTGRTTGD